MQQAARTSYKLQQEAFVSHLNGTTVTEIMVVLSVMPASTLFGACVYALMAGSGSLSARKTFALDFICTVVPTLLAFTVAAEWAPVLLCLLVLGSLTLCIYCRYDMPPSRSLCTGS